MSIKQNLKEEFSVNDHMHKDQTYKFGPTTWPTLTVRKTNGRTNCTHTVDCGDMQSDVCLSHSHNRLKSNQPPIHSQPESLTSIMYLFTYPHLFLLPHIPPSTSPPPPHLHISLFFTYRPPVPSLHLSLPPALSLLSLCQPQSVCSDPA